MRLIHAILAGGFLLSGCLLNPPLLFSSKPLFKLEEMRLDDLGLMVLTNAVIWQESGGNPKAVSSVGAKGLMQLMDRTGQEWHQKLGIVEPYDPFNPEQNRHIGTAYLKWLIEHLGGDVELALCAYNWGIGRVKKTLRLTQSKTFQEIEKFLPKETKHYVPSVLKFANLSMGRV